jgi:hypothetical protein
MIELNIVTTPREFDRSEFGTERLVEVDGHQIFPAMCSAAK